MWRNKNASFLIKYNTELTWIENVIRDPQWKENKQTTADPECPSDLVALSVAMGVSKKFPNSYMEKSLKIREFLFFTYSVDITDQFMLNKW